MASDSPVDSNDPPSAAPRVRPSLLVSVVTRANRLPAGGWWVFVLFGLALFAWGQAVLWFAGRMPVGTIDVDLLVLIPYGPFTLIGVGLGMQIARRALKSFWPATGWPDEERPAWEERLADMPAWVEAAAFVVGSIFAIASELAALPSLGASGASDTLAVVAYLPVFVAGYGLAAVGGLTTLRWLGLVARIHREAKAIDPFDPGPIYAFSRLTGVVGLSYLFTSYYSLTVNGATQAGNAASIAFIAVFMVVAVGSFIVPLWGIHGRLERAKDTLRRDVERRINVLAGELYARIDNGQYDAIAVINNALTGVNALRERIERLPTWPWPPQVIRGFVSALLLPIIIYVLTRVISGVI